MVEIGVGWDVTPLLDGKVDALLDYAESIPVKVWTEGLEVATLRLSDFGVKAYSLNLITNRDYYRKDKATVDKLTLATTKGYTFLKENPDKAAEIFSKHYPENKAAFARQSIHIVARQVGENEEVGLQSIEGWKQTITTLKGLGLLEKDISPTDVFIPKHQ